MAMKQYPEAIMSIFIEITLTSMPFWVLYAMLLLSGLFLWFISVYLFLWFSLLVYCEDLGRNIIKEQGRGSKDIRQQTHLIRILLISLPHFNTHSWRGNKNGAEGDENGAEGRKSRRKKWKCCSNKMETDDEWINAWQPDILPSYHAPFHSSALAPPFL